MSAKWSLLSQQNWDSNNKSITTCNWIEKDEIQVIERNSGGPKSNMKANMTHS